jgi:hypothetical protein
MNDHNNMNAEFVKSLMKDRGIETETEVKEPTRSYKIGLVVGTITVAVGTLCLEAAAIAFVANFLGWSISFLQGLSIAALFEYLSLRFIKG